jgi:uncharacterized protein YjiS (DUF1127 family)
MATGCATENLGFSTTKPVRKPARKGMLLQFLLRFEAWLDRRSSRRVLYQMDDRALADIGLSRADIEGLNTPSWQNYLPPTLGR